MTDDTARVQAAIDAAKARGVNCAELPAGETFRIAGKIRLPLGFVLSGGSAEQKNMTKLIFGPDGGFEHEGRKPETEEEKPSVQCFHLARDGDTPAKWPKVYPEENLTQYELSPPQWLEWKLRLLSGPRAVHGRVPLEPST